MKTVQGSDPMRYEVAKEVLHDIWKRHTEFLGSSRESGRKFFTGELGFLFKNKCFPAFSLDYDATLIGTLEDVSQSKTRADQLTAEACATSNVELMKKTILAYPALTFECEYTVTVYGSQADLEKSENGEERQLKEKQACWM